MNRSVKPLFVCLLLALLVSCFDTAAELGPGVVARIGGGDILYADFERYVLDADEEELGSLDSAVLAALFYQFLEQRLLLRLATDRKLVGPGRPPEHAYRLLMEAEELAPPDEEAIRQYYREHSDDFALGERVQLRQVLLQDRQTAQRVCDRLQAGQSFDSVGARFVDDPSAVFISAASELERDDLPRSLVEPVFALEVGQTSSVLEAEYGFHVFQVVAKRPAETQSLEAARPTIRRLLLQQAADGVRENLLQVARARYNLKIAAGNLPFPLTRLE